MTVGYSGVDDCWGNANVVFDENVENVMYYGFVRMFVDESDDSRIVAK